MIFFIIGLILFIISLFLFIKTNKKVEINKEIEEINKGLEEEKQRKEKEIQMYEQTVGHMKENMSNAMSVYSDQLDLLYNEKEKEYDARVARLEEAYDQSQQGILEQIEYNKKELDKIASTRAAAINAQLKEQEIQENRDFYTLTIPDVEKREIKIIKSIEDMLRDPRPLRMLIWSTYYLKKANTLCSNVLGPNKKTGIYKITSLIDGRCYIGQAVDVKERFRDHMKAGLGIDAPQNKFYEIMQQQGLENFTFELLEECPKDELNEKEKFYIELYKSYDYGLNSTRGNN